MSFLPSSYTTQLLHSYSANLNKIKSQSKSKPILSSSLSFSVDDENSHLYHDEEDDEEEEADRGGGMGGGDEGPGRVHSAPVFNAGELLPFSVETTLTRDKQVG